VLLASGAAGLLLMLALPGLATADPAVAEAPVAAVTPTVEAAPADTADQPAPPADEATPPAADQPAEPAAPVTDDGAGAAPAPPPSETTPITEPVSDGSTPAPQPVEVAPTPSTGSALPAQPDAPTVPADARPTTAVLAATTWDAPDAPQTVTLPSGPEATVGPVVAATEPDPAPVTADPSRAVPPPAAPDLSVFAFDASGPIAQPITTPRQAAPMGFTQTAEPPEGLPVAELVAPQNAAPGSSLLAVLASYILPGSGPVPPSAMMMLVLLGLVLAAVFAPRPAGSERIWLSGLLGPSTGHGLAVRRPG